MIDFYRFFSLVNGKFVSENVPSYQFEVSELFMLSKAMKAWEQKKTVEPAHWSAEYNFFPLCNRKLLLFLLVTRHLSIYCEKKFR